MNDPNILVISKIKLMKVTFAIIMLLVACSCSKGYILDVYNEITNTSKYSPICNVDTTENKVALTFEINGNNNVELTKTLNILKENNVKATFFVVGSWAQKNIDLIKAIHNDGHQLGNHTLTHSDVHMLTDTEFKNEVKGCMNVIKNILGVEMNTFKFPKNNFTDSHMEIIYDNSMYPIYANVISEDYKELGTEDIINNVSKSKDLSKGSIIEFTVGSKYLNESLPTIIQNLKDNSYDLVTIDDLIYKENFEITSNGTQKLKSN